MHHSPEQTVSRRRALQLGGVAALATLAACQQSEQRNPGQSAVSPQPAPGSSLPASPAAPLPPLAVIALNRLAFGPSPADWTAFQALPGGSDEERYAAFVEEQLNPAAIDDSRCDRRLAAAGLSTLGKSAEQAWIEHYLDEEEDYPWRELPLRDTLAATLIRAVYSRRQLFEVMVDFWHNHFNVFPSENERIRVLFGVYDRDVIRANALGNFRALLGAVAQSAPMLQYLDNVVNEVSGPNENYARELLELHTLGAENYLGVRDPATVERGPDGIAVGYVDNDVYEVARCFTGWRVHTGEGYEGMQDNGQFFYYRPGHDRFNKLVLGQYIRNDQPDLADGMLVLDLLAAHPGTARFIARKLCRRLISDTPPQEVVDQAAATFLAHKDAPDQLKRVVRTIVASQAFRTTWGEKIKRPFEVAVAMLRGLQADFAKPPEEFWWLYDPMGQPLFARQPPDGYPDVRSVWSTTMSLLYRWKLAIALAEDYQPDRADQETPLRIDLVGQTPADQRQPVRLVEFWAERLLPGRTLAPSLKASLAQSLSSDLPVGEPLDAELLAERLPRLVALLLMSPDFNVR